LLTWPERIDIADDFVDDLQDACVGTLGQLARKAALRDHQWLDAYEAEI